MCKFGKINEHVVDIVMGLSRPQRLQGSFWGRSPLGGMSAGADTVQRFRAGASARCHTQYGPHPGG